MGPPDLQEGPPIVGFFICCEVIGFMNFMISFKHMSSHIVPLPSCYFSTSLPLFSFSRFSSRLPTLSVLHTHTIFNCGNCKYSLYERAKLNQNHSEVIMKLVFKAVCLFSEACPAPQMLLWKTDDGTLFCNCPPVITRLPPECSTSCDKSSHTGWWERRRSCPRVIGWECLWDVWREERYSVP